MSSDHGSDEDCEEKQSQNHGTKLDLAKIIAQYQMQTKSLRSSQNGQPDESNESGADDPSKSQNNESAASGGLAQKSVATESQTKLIAFGNVSSKKPVPKQLRNSLATPRKLDASPLKHTIPVKTGSQLLKQNKRKEPPAKAATKDHVSHVAFSSSANGTIANRKAKAETKPASLKQNSKSKANTGEISRPKRPLTAYNIFFRDQRLKLLDQQKTDDQEMSMKKSNESTDRPETTNSHNSSKQGKKEQTTNVSSDKKKPKIGFSQLAKTVSFQWKSIDPQLRAYYETQAQLDMERYRKERDLYQETKMEALSQARLQLEMTVDSDTKERYLQGPERKSETKRKK